MKLTLPDGHRTNKEAHIPNKISKEIVAPVWKRCGLTSTPLGLCSKRSPLRVFKALHLDQIPIRIAKERVVNPKLWVERGLFLKLKTAAFHLSHTVVYILGDKRNDEIRRVGRHLGTGAKSNEAMVTNLVNSARPLV